MRTFTPMLLIWIGGFCMGIGTGPTIRGFVSPQTIIAECMEANNHLPFSEVRKHCEDKLAAVTKKDAQ